MARKPRRILRIEEFHRQLRKQDIISVEKHRIEECVGYLRIQSKQKFFRGVAQCLVRTQTGEQIDIIFRKEHCQQKRVIISLTQLRQRITHIGDERIEVFRNNFPPDRYGKRHSLKIHRDDFKDPLHGNCLTLDRQYGNRIRLPQADIGDRLHETVRKRFEIDRIYRQFIIFRKVIIQQQLHV